MVRRNIARAANTLSTARIASAPTQCRALSSTSRKASGHGHEDHYDSPGGWLWGIKPGEKVEDEGWEKLFFWGVYGSLGVAAAAYAFKPDTSIQTWALEEARRRLEAEGTLKEPEDKS